MYKGNSSRIIPIIIIIIVIAIAVAAIVSIGRAVFSGGDRSTTTEEVDVARTNLLKTSANHSVRMTTRGPIVADENFRSYQVTVSPSSRNITTYSGYLSKVIKSKPLSNNVAAYEEFVNALDKANMTVGTPFTGEDDNTLGICATGHVYEFDVLVDGKSVQHLWTSTCKGSKGSFRASVAQVQNLFLTQIPGSEDYVRSISLD